MFVMPLKWMPYALTIVGLICLFTGEADVTASIIMTLIGGVWTFLKHAPQKSAANQ